MSWTLAPMLLVRVPALPATALAELRLSRSVAAHSQLRTRAAALARAAAALADALTPHIAVAEPAPRARLRSLRRELRRGRVDAVASAAPAAPAALVDSLAAWLADAAAVRADAAARDATAEQEYALAHARQLARLTRPPLREALALDAPGLARHLAALDPAAPLRKQDRKAMRRALAFLWRAALKPVPRGRLAGVARAVVHATPAPPLPPLDVREVVIQPDRPLLDRLTAALLRAPVLRERARVRLAATAFASAEGPWCDLDDASPEPALAPAYAHFSAAPAGLSWADAAAAVGPATLAHAVERGMLRLDLGAAEDRADDLEVLTAALSDAEDPDLAGPRAQVRSYRAVLASLASGASVEPAASAGLADLVHEDTFLRAEVAVAADELAPALAAIVRHGAGRCCPSLLPEEAVLAALLDRVAPGGPAPFPTFYRAYRRAAAALALGDDHWANASRLAAALGVASKCPEDDVLGDIRAALEQSAGASAELRPDPAGLAGWTAAPGRRLACRLVAVRDADGDRARHVVLWGAQRMSLLPRACGLPLGDEPAAEVRQWFARWPAVADIAVYPAGNPDLRPRLTRRRIVGQGAHPGPGDVAPRDLWVDRGADGRVIVRDAADGAPLVPTFLGVSAPTRLPAWVQLLIHLGGEAPSYLDLVYRALHQELMRRLDGADVITRVPALRLDGLVLSTPLALVPASAWPRLDGGERAAFFACHDWLAAHDLPRGQIQVRPLHGTREARWIDLGHPQGVAQLRALARDAPALVIVDPWQDADLDAPEGRYRGELYLELQAHPTPDPDAR